MENFMYIYDMKKYTLIFLVLLMACQPSNKKVISKFSCADTLKTLINEDPEKAKIYADSILKNPIDSNNVAEAHYALGVYYNMKDKNDLARAEFATASTYAEKVKDSTKILACERQIATLYRKAGLYQESQARLFKVLQKAKKYNNVIEIEKILMCIQKNYIDKLNYNQAKVYNFQLDSLKPKGDINITNKFFLFDIYIAQDSIQQAKKLIKNLKNIKDSIELNMIPILYEDIAIIYEKEGQLDSALFLLESELKLEEKFRGKHAISLTLERMSDIYEKTNRLDSALSVYKKFHQTQMQLIEEEMSVEFVQKQTQFEEAQKRKIYQLKNEKQQQQQRNIIYIIVIILIFLSILTAIVYKNVKKAKKKNIELAVLNTKITHQKEEIIDSINYAKTIQNAVLVKEKDIVGASLIFKPKDIVSGDFYYYTQIGNKKYYAVGDCTGHGVPGAMLTMMAINKLKETIEKVDFKNVLEVLNKEIKKSLGQTTDVSGSKDGFDMSLVCIEGNKMLVSSANRPIFIVNNKVVEEIKAFKSSIGGHTPYDQKYEIVEKTLTIHDTVYLFSDGIVDQFGGDNNKKLMTKNFKNHISNLNGTLEDIKISVSEFFDTWKGETEQTDDVTMMVLKIN